MKRLSVVAIAVASFSPCLIACGPPPPAETPQEEPEPAPLGTIPWAEGAKPEEGAVSTREVGEQPRSQDAATEDELAEQDGGIIQAGNAQTCTGKVPPALRAAVQVRASDTHKCYDRVPEEKAGSEGDVKFNIRIGLDGTVSSVVLLEDTFKVPETTSCIEAVLKKRFEARPQGGCAMFVIPIHLAAEAHEAADTPETDEHSEQ